MTAHKHYCAHGHHYWQHNHLAPECQQQSTAGIVWIVAKACRDCLAAMYGLSMRQFLIREMLRTGE